MPGTDPSAIIAPTARVSPEAVVGPGARIGEFCVIDPDVVIGPGCVLEPYVYVKRWTTLGERNEVGAGTVLGTDPLDRNFDGARSYLRIGNGNKIREHFTISRGTPPESSTEIGDGNFIMTPVTSRITAKSATTRSSAVAPWLLATLKSRIRRSFQAASWFTSFRKLASSP